MNGDERWRIASEINRDLSQERWWLLAKEIWCKDDLRLKISSHPLFQFSIQVDWALGALGYGCCQIVIKKPHLWFDSRWKTDFFFITETCTVWRGAFSSWKWLVGISGINNVFMAERTVGKCHLGDIGE